MSAISYARESPAGKILDYLQRHGQATVRELEGLLGISTTAVREHLTQLQARGMLDTRLERKGAGRPRTLYFLTAKAQSTFPKAYDTLVNLLLRELAERGGPEQVEVVLAAVGARLAEEYRGKVSAEALSERLAELRAALEARSIPVEVQPSGTGFHVFACPYLDVAQEHAAVCTMERRMLEQVLGEALHIDGTIREGHRSCHFTLDRLTATDSGRSLPAENSRDSILNS